MNGARSVAQALRDYYTGVGEVGLSLGTGMAAQPVAGFMGMADLLRGRGGERAAQRVRDVGERLTYEPRSDVGRRGAENVGRAVEAVAEPLKQTLVDPVGDRVPVLGAAMLAGAEVIGPKGKPKAKPKPKPDITPQAAERAAAAERVQASRAARMAEAEGNAAALSAALREGAPPLDKLAEIEASLRPDQRAARQAWLDAPRFDPGSPQQLLPGVEPLSLPEAHHVALERLREAREAMTYHDPDSGLQFDYRPEFRGGGPAWEVNVALDENERSMARRPVNNFNSRPVLLDQLEGESTRTVPQGAFSSSGTIQAQVGQENFQRMMALSERLRGAEDEALARGNEAATTRSRELTERINRSRALAEEPGISADQHRQLQEEILAMQRQRPITIGETTVSPTPTDEGLFSPLRWSTALGDDATALTREYLRERPGYLAIQKRIVRQLRGEPEPPPVRRPQRDGGRLEDIPGRDPNAMNREAVAAFLGEARTQPELFLYGPEPPSSVRSLDDFADYFGRQADEDIDVSWDYADSDEPPKIKQPKEHGRGEVMRDRYGDYKMETLEEGDKLKDEYGNIKKKEVEEELFGPPREEDFPGEGSPEWRGPILWGTRKVPKRAEGGEWKRDESGEYVYQKSRGGEPVRDERGRRKYEEVENPDYSGDYDKATLSAKGGEIDITYGDPEATIHATEAGGKGAGQLLYQTALAHASRAGIPVGGGSLTTVNAYRLLSNVISNIARMGKNTRDLGATSSGRAMLAPRRGAEGPEVWRAEAEEGMQRLRGAGVDPDRVRFDPEKGFSIDGAAATAKDIAGRLGELSPYAGKLRGNERLAGVGQKSLMRNAVFQWLRTASPEEARRVAAKWPKEWGPIFAGIGAAAVGAGAGLDEVSQD